MTVETFYEQPFRPVPERRRELHIAVDERDVSSMVLYRELSISWFRRIPRKHRLNPDVLLKCCELEARRLRILSFFRVRWHDYQSTRLGAYPQYRLGRDVWQTLPQNEAMRESPAWTELLEDIADEFYAEQMEERRKKLNIRLWAAQSTWYDYEYEGFDASHIWDPSEIRTLTEVPKPSQSWKWKSWSLEQ